MIAFGKDGTGSRLVLVGKSVGPATDPRFDPSTDWKEANPIRIRKALDRALGRPSGGWYVVDATLAIGDGPKGYRIAGRDLVAWRCSDGRTCIAPEACPHMQAPLSQGRVREGKLVCPWHGLALGREGQGKWRAFESFDDGVLTWVRLDAADQPSDKPIIAPRPQRFLDAVIRVEVACEPADVIANRLDPWHGVHFHPHTFARLRVLDHSNTDTILLRVAYRIAGPVCVEVDCTFHSPEPRTIVMTIVNGEAVGSVVETHATPIDDGKTAVIEATLASSDRVGFKAATALSRILRPLVQKQARRLWVEDGAYAESAYQLRKRQPDQSSSARRPRIVHS